ncbi:unnamed protein product [Phytophthora fragariaefolia]|uniref:Unnamed protein product n=1 Tax=Phytophthora fragariaefolia TaxID=1490495 RepID=A0A9W6U794_9STRA|nr:unnamed protein product [Phytophthora fragariaefolia]
MFVGPQLTADQAVEVLEQAWRLSQGNKKRFLKIMKTLMKLHRFRLRDAAAVVDPSRRFDEMVAGATVRLKYRFTVAQLYQLASVLGLPRDGVRTHAGDNVPRVEALAMVCRRLSEAAKLYTVATEFGRSTSMSPPQLSTDGRCSLPSEALYHPQQRTFAAAVVVQAVPLSPALHSLPHLPAPARWLAHLHPPTQLRVFAVHHAVGNRPCAFWGGMKMKLKRTSRAPKIKFETSVEIGKSGLSLTES